MVSDDGGFEPIITRVIADDFLRAVSEHDVELKLAGLGPGRVPEVEDGQPALIDLGEVLGGPASDSERGPVRVIPLHVPAVVGSDDGEFRALELVEQA
jgi:hypothetical protein